MAEELIHYAAEPVTLDRTRTYDQRAQRLAARWKPLGLWVSVAGDDDWESWCTVNEFGLNRLKVPHLVTLKPGARITRLSTPEMLDAFDALYGIEDRFGFWRIDWNAAAIMYDGIIIAPYCWERRLTGPRPGIPWYYGWDCASGCIWNMDAIADMCPRGAYQIKEG